MAEQPEDEESNNGLPEGFEWGDLSALDATMNSESVGIHEVYKSHCQGGFTPKQAIYLLTCQLTGNPGFPPDDLPKED